MLGDLSFARLGGTLTVEKSYELVRRLYYMVVRFKQWQSHRALHNTRRVVCSLQLLRAGAYLP